MMLGCNYLFNILKKVYYVMHVNYVFRIKIYKDVSILIVIQHIELS